ELVERDDALAGQLLVADKRPLGQPQDGGRLVDLGLRPRQLLGQGSGDELAQARLGGLERGRGQLALRAQLVLVEPRERLAGLEPDALQRRSYPRAARKRRLGHRFRHARAVPLRFGSGCHPARAAYRPAAPRSLTTIKTERPAVRASRPRPPHPQIYVRGRILSILY